jgi:hypothetical protein
LDEIRVLTPAGTVGYGYSIRDFEHAVEQLDPHVIAVDAGSTDPGPYCLGSGVPFVSRLETKEDLEPLIRASVTRRIPLIIGSAGGAGGRPHVEWTCAIVADIANDNGWSFTMATIEAELSAEQLLQGLSDGRLHTFESGVPANPDAIQCSDRIVAQMGPEPIIQALQQGADVIVAGRACDDAVIAALPIMKGFDRGLALHMGKILECGAMAAEPIGQDGMLGTLRRDHFELVPVSPNRECTVMSVGGHSLYERENPYLQAGPGGLVDLRRTTIEAIGGRTVRVSGAVFIGDEDYKVKIEGVRSVGYRTTSIAGVRCPAFIGAIDEALRATRQRTEAYFKSAGVPSTSYRWLVHQYGRNAVMGCTEPNKMAQPHEIGLLVDVVADTQELAHAVCHRVTGTLMHLEFPGQYNNAGNLAFPYSPSELDCGTVYEFSIYHLLSVADPLSLFPIRLTVVAGTGNR